MRKSWMIAGVVGLLAVVAVGGWAAWTIRAAEQHLQAARTSLLAARSALGARDGDAAATAVQAAAASSAAAAGLAQRTVWSAAAALPRIGDTPRAARSLVLAADEAIGAAADLVGATGGLDPRTLVDTGGGIDLATLATLGDAARSAQAPLATAKGLLATTPTSAAGAWVIPPVEKARAELAEQVGQVAEGVDALADLGSIGPGLLGADGPRTYFVAVQAPNETRGTGGLVGTWAVLRADGGRLSVVEVGSNDDLPNLDALPGALGADYTARYGADPQLFVNMNVSPDLPSAATLWLASWRARTGQRLDGVLSIDVTAIGDLLTAAGTTLTAPDGLQVRGPEFASFTLSGIYERFPTPADSAARKAYQEALAAQALAAVLDLADPAELGRAAWAAVAERRIGLWVADPAAQSVLEGTRLAHALSPAGAHSVEPSIINVGWSKLDTYIDREFTYEVGRCPSGEGIVTSELTMRLTSDIAPGTTLPPYVVGAVRRTDAGPVNKVLLQAHLPTSAEVIEVFVDGESVGYAPFVEAGRTGIVMTLELPPQEVRELRVLFTEPASGRPGEVLVQPMARDATVVVRDRPC